jgi:hypothetical protein
MKTIFIRLYAAMKSQAISLAQGFENLMAAIEGGRSTKLRNCYSLNTS